MIAFPLLVEHCDIHDAPHVGMLIGGNDHVIAFNSFSYIGNEFVDMYVQFRVEV